MTFFFLSYPAHVTQPGDRMSMCLASHGHFQIILFPSPLTSIPWSFISVDCPPPPPPTPMYTQLFWTTTLSGPSCLTLAITFHSTVTILGYFKTPVAYPSNTLAGLFFSQLTLMTLSSILLSYHLPQFYPLTLRTTLTASSLKFQPLISQSLCSS